MKISPTIAKFLTNKWVLNIVSFLALFNVIGYAIMGNVNCVVMFIVISALISYFSKNMTIVLGVPLLLVNLFVLGKNKREGLENNSTKEKPTANVTAKKPNKKNKQSTKTSQGLSMNEISNEGENATQNTGEQDGFEPGRSKNKGHDIDYATTIEDAYDELNNILGSDGIQRLTTDSQKLMEQQLHLAEAMKNMTPLFKSIEPMVQNLQGMMGQMDGKNGLGGIMDLAKKLVPDQLPK